MNGIAQSKNEITIQDPFLENIIKSKKLAKVYLRNGICLQGYIELYDKDAIIVKEKEKQLIYKNSIATIMINSITHNFSS
jgi:host factor-I protein